MSALTATTDLFAAPVARPEPQDPIEWFCWRLALHRIAVAERSVAGIRAAILEHAPSTVCGRGPDRRPERYSERFERVFGEPLVPKKKRTRAA